MIELTNTYPVYPKDKKWFKLENLDHFVEVVLQWASEHNLLEGTTNLLQCPKLDEERGELLKNIVLGGDIRDDIGDILVVVVQMMWRDGSSTKLGSILLDFVRYGDFITPYKHKCYPIEMYYDEVVESVNSVVKSHLHKSEQDYEKVITDLYCLSLQANTTLLECCEIAFNDIKDREGKMINGSFVKETKQETEEVL